ncbi:hypothetical protein EPO15_07240 [bacterium]|nr:MAG: hypothetical protein EPO15_07240 [bacterium]
MPSAVAVHRIALLAVALGGAFVTPAQAHAPGAPGTPAVTNLSTDSVSWAWTAGLDADSYQIFLASSMGGPYLTTAATSFTHAGLGPNGLSDIYVRGLHTGEDGPFSGRATAYSSAALPSGLAVSSVTGVYAVLSWGAAGNPAETFYDLQKSLDGSSFATHSTYTVTVATVSGLAADTSHYFRLRAYNKDSVATDFAGPVSTKTAPTGGTPLPAPPAAPSGSALSTSAVSWSWGAVSGATGYRVSLGTKSYEFLASTPAAAFVHAGLTANETSGIAVSAVNVTGEGPPSPSAVKTTLAMPPTGSSAAVVTANSVTLGWGANGNPSGTVYEVQSTTEGGSFAFAGNFNNVGATLSGLTSDTTWQFRVRAQNQDAVLTAFDAVVTTRTGVPFPGQPGNPASTFISTAEVVWAWSAATDATAYQVRLATASGTLVATPTAPAYAHVVGPNALSSLIVRGQNANGVGPFTSTVTVHTYARAPTSLALSSVTSLFASLTWSADGNPAGTTYLLEKSTEGGAFEAHSTYTVTAATVAVLLPSTTYTFRVLAVNDDLVATAYSGTVSTVTAATGGTPPPGNPGSPTPTVLSTAEVSWEWTAASDAESYRVFLDSKPAELLTTVPTTGFIHAELPINSRSAIRVQAVNGTGVSPQSNGASVYTKAMVPSTPTFTVVGHDNVSLAWDEQGNPPGTEYEVEGATVGGVFDVLSGATFGVVDLAGLQGSTTYQFRIRALNFGGVPTGYSGVASTRTLEPPPPAPGAPTPVVLSTGDVAWSWTTSTAAVSYEVRYATEVTRLLLSTAVGSFTLRGLGPNEPSGIVVRGVNAAGPGPLSGAATAYTWAMAPASLADVSVASTTLYLSWDAAGNPAGTYYELQRATDGATFLAYSTYTVAAATVSALAPATTFEFRVRAANGDGVTTAFSNTLATGTAPPLPGVPGVPGTFFLSTGAVTWAWTPGSDTVSYELVLDSDTAQVLAAPAVSSATLTFGPNERSAVRVRGVNAAGSGPLSGVGQVYTLAMPPSALAVTDVQPSAVSLSWNASGNPGGTSYQVQLSSAGGPFGTVSTVGSEFADVGGLSSATAHSFRVRALNGDGVTSAFSSSLSTTTKNLPPGVPGTPSAAFLSTLSVTWAWTPAADASSYEAFLASETATLVAAPAVSSFTLTPGPNAPSAVVVRGVNVAGPGPLSGAATVYTLAAEPTGLAAVDVTANSADLAWQTGGNPPGTVYQLEASSGGPYVSAAVTSALGASLAGLSSSTAYGFRVRAVNEDGVPGGYSGVLATATHALGGQPAPGATGTPATVLVSSADVSWAWSPASDADRYKVFPASNTAVLLASPTAAGVVFSGMTPNRPSAVVVRGVNDAGNGPLSAAATAYTLALAPSALAVDEVSFTSVTVSWSGGANPAGTEYRLETSTDLVSYTPYSTTTAASAYVGGFSSDTVYGIRVQAANADGVPTAYAPAVSTRTLSPIPGPTGTPAPVVLSTGDVSWTWAAADRALGYEVSLASDTLSVLASTGAAAVVLRGYAPNTLSAIRVRGTNTDGPGPLSASGAAYTLSMVPTSLTGADAASTTLHLVWSPAGNPAATDYELQMDVGSGFFYAGAFSVAEATVSALSPATTYQFRVLAYNHDGVQTAYSAPLATGTAPPFPGAPGTPAAAYVSTGVVTWAWTAASDAATYEALRASDTASVLAAPAVSSFTLTSGPNEPSGVVVRGVNAAGAGPLSASATVYTLAMPPTALAVTAVSATSAELTWSASGNAGGTTYHIERSTDGSLFFPAGDTAAVGATVAGLSSATAYSFRLRAENGNAVLTEYSNVAATQTSNAVGPLPGLAGTPFTLFVSSDDVSWTWAGSSAATSYKVFPASSPATLLGAPATNLFSLSGMGPNVRSAIAVAGINAEGEGPLSAAATAYTYALPPASLALGSVGASSVTLSWSAGGNPAGTRFKVDVSFDGVFFVPFTTTTAVSLAAVSLASSTDYSFRVSALNGDLVETAFSNSVTTTTLSPLPGPTGTPSAVAASTGHVTWGWSAAVQASSYQVYLATKTSELVAAPTAASTVRFVGPNQATSIVVRGTNTFGAGPLSGAATAYSWAKPPTSLALTAVSSAAVGLSWSANGNPAGTVYELQLSTDGAAYAVFSTMTAAAASADLAASTTYFFQVRARNADLVNTAFAAAVSTRTLPPLPGTPGTPFTASVSTGGVAWVWAGGADAASYQVSLASNTAELLSSPTTNTFLKVLGPNEPSGVVVRALNATGSSPLSASATAYSWAKAPTSFALTSVSSYAVGLSWSANGNPAGTVYELQLSTDGAAYSPFSTTTAVSVSAALSASSTYFFQVRARNADLVDTAFAAAVSTRTLPPLPGTPGTPFAASVSTGGVAWVWAGAADAASYQVSLASNTAELLSSPTTNTFLKVLGPNEPSGVVVRALNATGSSPLSASATAYSWAKAPTSFALTSVSSAAVGLSWSANGNPAGTVYELQLSTDGAAYSSFSTMTAVTASAVLSPSSTYFFQVRARNGDLVTTAFAAAVSTRTLPPLPGTPGAPFTASVSTGGVAWVWAGAANAASYQVSLASNTAELLSSPTTNTFLKVLGPNEPSGVVVRALNATGSGSLSASATAYSWAQAPASLGLTAVTSGTVGLSWSANGNPAGTVYELQRSTDGTTFAAFSTYTAAAATAGGLAASTTYFFQVRARNGDLVTTAFAAAVSTRTLPPVPGAPGTPFTASVSTGGVAWVWAGLAEAASYEVVLATKVSEVLAAPTTNATTRVSGPNEPSAISVRALNPSGAGPLSSAATAYSWAMPPASLALTAVSSAAAGLSWSANGNPAGTLYELQLSLDGSAYAPYSTYAVTGATPALAASTTYYFRVRARSGDAVDTAFASAVSTSTLPPAPGQPGTPVGAALGVASVSWTWGAAADASGYSVFVASDLVAAASTTASASYLELGLSPNVPAGLVVAGVNPSGQGALSAAATVYTLAMPPASLALTAVSSSAAGLSWSANGNPAGTLYELQLSPDGSAYTTFSTYAVAAATPALSASTTYFFRVRALNGDLVATDFAPAVSTRTFPPAPGQPGTPAGTALGTSSISWTWAVATDAAGYAVFAASSPALAVAAPVAAAFSQTGLAPNTAAGLLVAGVNPSGQGPLSAAATVYTLAAVPSGAAAPAVHQTSASVSWGLNGNPAGTLAEIQRSTDGAAFTAFQSTTATGLTMTDLLVCASYWVRVRNLNGDGLPTAYDGAAFLTLPSTPTAPGGLSAAPLAGNRVSLSWTPSGSESVTEYRLYWDSGTGTVSYASPLAVVPATMTSHQTAVLASSAAYRFALRAFNRCGLEEANVGVLASAPSLTSLTGVKAAPTAPLSGQRVKGDRVTVAAGRTLGAASDVVRVLFQYKASSASAWADIPAVGGDANPDTSEPYYVHWNADGLGLAAAQSFDLRAVAYDVSGASDAAPSAVTVSVVTAAATDYDVAEGLVGGKLQKSQVLDNTVTTTLQTGGSVPTSLTIPAGALDSGQATVAVVNDPGVLSGTPTGAESAGTAVQITLSGGQTQLANGKTAAVTLGYPDADGDGLVDGTTLRADRLVMFSAPALAGPWTRDFGSSVDAAGKSVTGNTPHFSFFALFAVASASLDALRVYPVPYMPNGGNADQGVPFAAGNPNSGIVFDNLPNSVTIKIYTVTGQRVAQFGSGSSGGKVQWDVKNDRGQDVASGGYIAVITSPGANPVTKRILVVR